MLKYALSIKQSLLFTYLSFIGCKRKYFQKALHIDYEFPEALYRDGDIFWDYENDTSFNEEFLNKRTLNQAVDHFNKSLEKATNNLEKVTKDILKKFESIKDNRLKLQQLFIKYFEAYLLNMPFLFHFWNTEYLLIKKLEDDFKTIFGGKRGERILQRVLIPSKDTYFTRERRSLEKIKIYLYSNKEYKNSRIVQTMLKKHVETFGFTSIVFGIGKPLEESNLLKRINADLSKNALAKLKAHRAKEQNDKREIQRMLKQLLSNREVYKRVKLAQDLMFWKNQRLDILFKCDYLMISLFNRVAGLIGINYQEFIHLTYDEIMKWFKNNRFIPSESILNKRIKSYALHLKNDKISLYVNKSDYPKMEDAKNQITSYDSKVLKGNTAYKGRVLGIVKLVFGIEDIKKIEKGNILVTKMTRPEMVVGLEKAAAFVTDQGGMLSHAAIVSREMRKPCIVGTKIATQILKDGDLVEVNANDGTVKKLN